MHASVRICLGHYFYIFAWISRLFGTVVVLEEKKRHLKHYLKSVEVKVTFDAYNNAWISKTFGTVILLEE